MLCCCRYEVVVTRPSAQHVSVQMLDGTSVVIQPGFVVVQVPGSRRGQMTGGLGGSNDNNATNDLAMADASLALPCVSPITSDATLGLNYVAPFVEEWVVANASNTVGSALWMWIQGGVNQTSEVQQARAVMVSPLSNDAQARWFNDGLAGDSALSEAFPSVPAEYVRDWSSAVPLQHNWTHLTRYCWCIS